MSTADDYDAQLAQARAGTRPIAPPEPGAPNGKPHRLTMTQVLEAHLAAMLKPAGVHSSVTVSRNAKGDFQYEVVVRAGDRPEIQTAADCAAEAHRIAADLAALLPMTAAAPASPSKAAGRGGKP